jgi:hypothetical protein
MLYWHLKCRLEFPFRVDELHSKDAPTADDDVNVASNGCFSSARLLTLPTE